MSATATAPVKKEETAAKEKQEFKFPLPVHPLANKFPMLSGERQKAFQAKVQSAGRITDAVVIIRKGSEIGFGNTYDGPDAILDGRNRTMNGILSGIKWDDIPQRDYSLTKDGPVEEFIDRTNGVGRRHLTEQELTLAAADLSKELFNREKEALEKDKKVFSFVESALVTAPPAPASKPATEADSKKPAAKKAKAEKTVKAKRLSHEAREKAAKQLGVSVDSVKKAASIQSHPDLVDKYKAGTISLDLAAREAAARKAAESAKKNATSIVEQRKESLTYLSTTFGKTNAFVQRVVSKKIFGDESTGHKDLRAFCELKHENAIALIPLLWEGLTFKAAQEIYAGKPDASWSANDLRLLALSKGLGRDGKTVKSFTFGDVSFTVEITKTDAAASKALVTRV
jgi:hypothetical protein